jgi:hypothetical protein
MATVTEMSGEHRMSLLQANTTAITIMIMRELRTTLRIQRIALGIRISLMALLHVPIFVPPVSRALRKAQKVVDGDVNIAWLASRSHERQSQEAIEADKRDRARAARTIHTNPSYILCFSSPSLSLPLTPGHLSRSSLSRVVQQFSTI